jgi:hypothetical protein
MFFLPDFLQVMPCRGPGPQWRQAAIPALPKALLQDILQDIDTGEIDVDDTAQARALKNHRKRLRELGMARFDVLGLDADRKLIRSLAKRLAANDPGAKSMRATLSRALSPEKPGKGGILAALRRSPLVGVDLDLARESTRGRKVDL